MKKNKKLNFKKIFYIIIFIIIILYLNTKMQKYLLNYFNNNSSLENTPSYDFNYKIIKQDLNKNYSGIGQEQVKNKDGYFTTFTTFDNYKKTYKEYKQNGNSSWSNNEYWGGTMSENGCGITALAIILSGYNKNFTPEQLRKKYYPVLNYEQMSKVLSSTFKIENSDFYYDTNHLSSKSIIEHLSTNRPIIICVWNKPTINRWTTASHYMVLLASDSNNMVYISNPNGGENDYKSSGWYEISEIIPYIAKALYINSY